MNNFNSFVAANTNGVLVRNNIFDQHGNDTTEFTCHAGDTDTTIDWNTMQNGSGNDNGECEATGDGSNGYSFVHNSVGPTTHDAVGANGAFNHNTTYDSNYFHDVGLNCGACGTASAIEVSAAQQTPGDHTRRVTNNYVVNAGGWCFSIIGDYEIGNNYCTGHNTTGGSSAVIEWDERADVTAGAFSNVHDNNLDSGVAGSVILGPYAPEPGSSLTNNIAADIEDEQCDAMGNCGTHCVFGAVGTCSDYGLNYTPFSGQIPPPPPIPAAGAAP